MQRKVKEPAVPAKRSGGPTCGKLAFGAASQELPVKIRNRHTPRPADVPDSSRRTFNRRCSGLAAALLIEAVPYRAAFAASGDDLKPAARLQSFLEEFARTETEETSLDLSAAAFRRRLKTTSAKLHCLRAIGRNSLKGDDLLNYRFAESLLIGQELAQERKLWSMDPRVYLPFSEL